MTTLLDLQKAATNAARNKNQQARKTKTSTQQAETTKAATTKQQQDAVAQMQQNIQNQGMLKGNITTTQQGAENKIEQSFLSKSTDKEKAAYNQMVNNGITPSAARAAINNVIQQQKQQAAKKTVDTWTDKQQNAYDTLLANGFTEKQAKKAVQKAIQADWSTGKKVGTAVMSFGQGVSDVGQRTVGKVIGKIDRVEGKLDNLYENSEGFQNLVNKAGQGIVNAWNKSLERKVDRANAIGGLFGAKQVEAPQITDEDIKAFQQSEAERKAAGIPSTYGSILSDEQASSRIGTIGRKTGQFAGSTALSMAAGGLASGGAKAIGTSLGSKAIGGLAGTVLGAGEGALTSDIYARGMSDRRATKGEAIGGAIAGGILGGISGYRQTAKALANNKKLENLIQDHSSKAKDLAASEGRIVEKKGALQTEVVQELSQKEKDALQIIKKEGLYNPKNPGKLSTNIQKSISKTATEMSDDMKNIKVSDRGKQELKDKLKDIVKNPDDWTKANQDKITKLIKKVDDVTNADELWKLRQGYDDLFSAGQKAGYGKGGTTETMYDLWQSGRRILNDAMNDAAEKAGKETVKEGMKKLNTLINTRAVVNKNLGKQIGDVNLTRLGRVVKGAKTGAKKVVGGGLLLGGGYLGGKKGAAAAGGNYNYSE